MLFTAARVAGSTVYFNNLLSASFGKTSVDIVSVSLLVKSKFISFVKTLISVTWIVVPVVSITWTCSSAVTSGLVFEVIFITVSPVDFPVIKPLSSTLAIVLLFDE